MKIFPSKPIQGNVFMRDNFPEPRNLYPFVTGDGSLDYICGNCSHIILKTIRPRQITQAIYKCPKCGTYNQIDSNLIKH